MVVDSRHGSVEDRDSSSSKLDFLFEEAQATRLEHTTEIMQRKTWQGHRVRQEHYI